MRLNASEVRRAALRCGVLALATLAVSCGGGSAASNFVATRILAFGDETSVIVDVNGDANGSKYSVNAAVSTTDATIACRSSPLWIQVIASNFSSNLVFPQCNPGPTLVTNPPSRIRATLGAVAADVSAQIDAQISESSFQAGDLATLMVGANDVLGQYAQYPTVSEAQLTANVTAAGAEAGRQVNRLANLGAKVIVSTIPDVGYSPYAIAERNAHIDTDRQQLIIRLVKAYNDSLRATLVNDGTKIGLVLMDEIVEGVAKFVGLNGFTNATDGVCDLSQSLYVPPSILDCTNNTLIAGGTPSSYLWADDRHLSAGGQNALGNIAASRARNNPF